MTTCCFPPIDVELRPREPCRGGDSQRLPGLWRRDFRVVRSRETRCEGCRLLARPSRSHEDFVPFALQLRASSAPPGSRPPMKVSSAMGIYPTPPPRLSPSPGANPSPRCCACNRRGTPVDLTRSPSKNKTRGVSALSGTLAHRRIQNTVERLLHCPERRRGFESEEISRPSPPACGDLARLSTTSRDTGATTNATGEAMSGPFLGGCSRADGQPSWLITAGGSSSCGIQQSSALQSSPWSAKTVEILSHSGGSPVPVIGGSFDGDHRPPIDCIGNDGTRIRRHGTRINRGVVEVYTRLCDSMSPCVLVGGPM